MNNVKVRAAKKSDFPFILASWARGVYFGHSWYRAINRESFFKYYVKYIEDTIGKCELRVACFDDDEDIVLGYAALSGTHLYWSFTKKAWRQQGIQKLLVPGSEIRSVGTISKPGHAIMIKQKWAFEPWR